MMGNSRLLVQCSACRVRFLHGSNETCSGERIQSPCWLSGWTWFSISISSSQSGIIRCRCTLMFWYWPSWLRGLSVESVPNRTKASSIFVSEKTWQRKGKACWEGAKISPNRVLCFINVQLYLALDKLLDDFFGKFKGRLFPGCRVGHGKPHIHAQHHSCLQRTYLFNLRHLEVPKTQNYFSNAALRSCFLMQIR